MSKVPLDKELENCYVIGREMQPTSVGVEMGQIVDIGSFLSNLCSYVNKMSKGYMTADPSKESIVSSQRRL